MSTKRTWLKRLRSRRGQSATEYVLVISLLSVAAMWATTAFTEAYGCMFIGECGGAVPNNGGVPAALAESLTKDGIQTIN